MKVKHIVEAEAGGLRAFKDLALFEIMDLIDLTTSTITLRFRVPNLF